MEKTCSYFKNAWLEKSGLINKESVFSCLLAGILIAIPLKYAFSSLATILLITVAFSSFFKIKFSFNTHLFLPVIFYLIMLTSLMWTSDTELTSGGLQKELAFLFVPLPFLFIPDIKKTNKHLVFRLFSLSMVFYALFYFVKAALRYRATGDISVFFYHELVTQDLSAIYVSVFASFAIFYFVAKKNKNYFEKASLFILIALVFLLSSKSIITIDFILIVCYYSFFSDIPKSVKATTVIAVFLFLFFSLVYVKEVRERFLLEYETAFVDNTVNNKIGNDNAKVFNVSLKQAWYNDTFQSNHFFPGTALRIYQVRAFKEMFHGNNILFTGFGLGASQVKIREKAAAHNLNPSYGDFNFHNQYVQTFAEIGIFGFFVLIAMLYSNLKNAWQNEDFLHIAFAVTMIVLFLTESFFCRQRGVLFFITLYCVFNATLKPTEEKYNF